MPFVMTRFNLLMTTLVIVMKEIPSGLHCTHKPYILTGSTEPASNYFCAFCYLGLRYDLARGVEQQNSSKWLKKSPGCSLQIIPKIPTILCKFIHSCKQTDVVSSIYL